MFFWPSLLYTLSSYFRYIHYTNVLSSLWSYNIQFYIQQWPKLQLDSRGLADARHLQRETYLINRQLTFPQSLFQQVMLGLQLNDEVTAVQVLLEFLRHRWRRQWANDFNRMWLKQGSDVCSGQQKTDFAVLWTPQIQSVPIGGFNFCLIGEAWVLSRILCESTCDEFGEIDRTGWVDFHISLCKDDSIENHVLKDLLKTWTSSLS